MSASADSHSFGRELWLEGIPGRSLPPSATGHFEIQKLLAVEALSEMGDGEENASEGISSAWRQVVAQWFYDVVDHLEEARSVVYLAMNILDRYCSSLSAGTEFSEADYQLASMAALFLAVRIGGSKNLRLSKLQVLSRRQGFTAADIMSTATSINATLDLSRRVITPFEFISSFLTYLPQILPSERTEVRGTAMFLAEIAVCDTPLSSYSASEVAYAAVMIATSTTLSPCVASAFAAAIANSTDVDMYANNVTSISGRLLGIHRKNNAGSSPVAGQVSEVLNGPDIQEETTKAITRVVSVEDLQSLAASSGMKRSQTSHFSEGDEGNNVKRNRTTSYL